MFLSSHNDFVEPIQPFVGLVNSAVLVYQVDIHFVQSLVGYR